MSGRTALKEGLGENPSHCRRAHFGVWLGGQGGGGQEKSSILTSAYTSLLFLFFDEIFKFTSLVQKVFNAKIP